MDQITVFVIIIIFLIILIYLIKRLFSYSTQKKVANNQIKKSDDSGGRDPVLHYEVTKGKSGDPNRQSLSYSGKKTRWR
jgi:hypothetical protein